MTDREQTTQAMVLAVSGLLGREVALDALLDALIERMRVALGADRGTLYLIDGPRAELVSRVGKLPEIDEIRLAMGQGIAGYVAESGRSVNVPTTATDARFFAGVDAATGYRTSSVVAVPVRGEGGQIIGVVQLLNKLDGAFSVDDEAALARLADEAACVIEASTLTAAIDHRVAPEDGVFAARFNGIIGESEPLRAACRLTERAAQTEATVLIRGESGTGKELFARALHVNSPRQGGPFVKVDCAALPATLIDNELFGHERGSYTGADARADGKLDVAAGGTLFLDEVGELPVEVQGKLLRLLQDRTFQRIGGTSLVRADVRVVAATNRNLEAMIERKTFRADLYYRLKVVQLELPPLRARGADDVIFLARHFVGAAARRLGRSAPELSAPAIDRLAAYPWPGNVRELENCIEGALIISDGASLGADDLPLPAAPGRGQTRDAGAWPDSAGTTPDAGEGSAAGPLRDGPTAECRGDSGTAGHVGDSSTAECRGDSGTAGRVGDGFAGAAAGPGDTARPGAAAEATLTLAAVERAHIERVLARFDGHRAKAAAALGIGRNTLTRKLKKYRL